MRVYMHSICMYIMYIHREMYVHTGSYWYRYIWYVHSPLISPNLYMGSVPKHSRVSQPRLTVKRSAFKVSRLSQQGRSNRSIKSWRVQARLCLIIASLGECKQKRLLKKSEMLHKLHTRNQIWLSHLEKLTTAWCYQTDCMHMKYKDEIIEWNGMEWNGGIEWNRME